MPCLPISDVTYLAISIYLFVSFFFFVAPNYYCLFCFAVIDPSRSLFLFLRVARDPTALDTVVVVVNDQLLIKNEQTSPSTDVSFLLSLTFFFYTYITDMDGDELWILLLLLCFLLFQGGVHFEGSSWICELIDFIWLLFHKGEFAHFICRVVGIQFLDKA